MNLSKLNRGNFPASYLALAGTILFSISILCLTVIHEWIVIQYGGHYICEWGAVIGGLSCVAGWIGALYEWYGARKPRRNPLVNVYLSGDRYYRQDLSWSLFGGVQEVQTPLDADVIYVTEFLGFVNLDVARETWETINEVDQVYIQKAIDASSDSIHDRSR